MSKIFITLMLCFVAGAALAKPADGNGNKEVYDWEYLDVPIFCDGDEVPDLSLDLTGWSQVHFFGKGRSRNVELQVFHLNSVYTNAAGDTWVWRDRGPDRYYFVTNADGVPEMYWAITGRSGWNIIGHAVLNLDTGELRLVAGQHPFGGDEENFMDFWADDLACEILH